MNMLTPSVLKEQIDKGNPIMAEWGEGTEHAVTVTGYINTPNGVLVIYLNPDTGEEEAISIEKFNHNPKYSTTAVYY